jgi:hypothetical protein
MPHASHAVQHRELHIIVSFYDLRNQNQYFT